MGELVHAIADPTTADADRSAAERELCRLLEPRLRLYGMRHLGGDRAAAADLAQDALEVVLRSARTGKIDKPEHVARFVLGVCRNKVARMRRSERRARDYQKATLPLAGEAPPPPFSGVDGSRLTFCLGMLGAREQRVLMLTYNEDCSSEEIAERLQTSAGNVRVLRHRAMAALRLCVTGGPT